MRGDPLMVAIDFHDVIRIAHVNILSAIAARNGVKILSKSDVTVGINLAHSLP